MRDFLIFYLDNKKVLNIAGMVKGVQYTLSVTPQNKRLNPAHDRCVLDISFVKDYS